MAPKLERADLAAVRAILKPAGHHHNWTCTAPIYFRIEG